MKPKEIKKLQQANRSELMNKLDQLNKDLVITKSNIKAGKEKNLHSAKKIRHEIAVIKTIITQLALTQESNISGSHHQSTN